MVRRAHSQIVDKKACTLLRSHLEDDWVLDEPNAGNDFGIDFHARLFQGGELSEYECKIQLKGRDGVTPKKGVVSQPVPTKNLVDWLDKNALPVFLVVGDVKRRRLYYVWIQRYLESLPTTKDWRKQKELTIKVDASQTLGDRQQFNRSVVDAFDKWLAPERSIARETTRLQALDPRFRVNVKASSAGVDCLVSADRSPVDIELHFSSSTSDLHERLDSLLNRGRPVSFSRGEVQAKGSPLLESYVDRDITLHAFKAVPATLRLERLHADGNVAASFTFPVGKCFLARKEIRFEGQTEDGCYRIVHTLPAENGALAGRVGLELRVNLDRYQGSHVALLPYIDQFANFADFDGGSRFGFEILTSGNRLASGQSEEIPPLSEINDLGDALRFWVKARQVSAFTGAVLPFDKHVSLKDRKNVMFWHSMFCCGAEQPGDGVVINFAQDPASLREMLTHAIHKRKELGHLKLVYHNPQVSVLGQQIQLEPFSIELTEVRLDPPRAELLKRIKRMAPASACSVRFLGTKRSILKFRQPPDTELLP